MKSQVAAEGFSAWTEKRSVQSFFLPRNAAAGHDSAIALNRIVADVTGCDELSGDDFPDEGQGVVGLNHLATQRLWTGLWEEGVELCFDALEAGLATASCRSCGRCRRRVMVFSAVGMGVSILM